MTRSRTLALGRALRLRPARGRRRRPGTATVLGMILVGLTGGIGSGKSTVSAALAARGAIIVDADQVVRDVQQPGSPVLSKLAERFGAEVIAADGSLDRAALAGIAFADADAAALMPTVDE